MDQGQKRGRTTRPERSGRNGDARRCEKERERRRREEMIKYGAMDGQLMDEMKRR